MSLPEIPRFSDANAFDLADWFRALGISRESLRAATERGDDLRNPLMPTRATLFNDDPATVAIRLFFCGVAVNDGIAERALSGPRLAVLKKARLLVEREPGELVCPFHLRMVRDLFLFSDYLGQDRDAVMGAGETTAVLFQAGRPANSVERALDLGCGAGTLALLLAADAKHVIGTDINERAVALARLNAAVNGIANAEFRAGDTYQPVDGEQFDLILSQPAYYPNPKGGERSDQIFLHGGVRGDELALRVMYGIPQHLTRRGRAVVFTSWPSDHERICLPGFRILELNTNRLELHGTRQSINVVEHEEGAGWSVQADVPADCWGHVQRWRIDQIWAAQALLRGPEDKLLSARLQLAPGATTFRDEEQLLLTAAPEALLGCIPIHEEEWRVIRAADRKPADLPLIRKALAAGVLVVTN